MILGPRFLIQAGFIIAVAVVAGIERLGTWSIIGLVAGAWIVVAVVELALWARNAKTRGLAPQGPDPTSSEPEPPTPEAVVLAPEPVPTPALPLNEEPREWNLWELERAAREHASDDVARNEERAYLLMYLREFAGPDGMLPADFDGLVRDAFGELPHSGGEGIR